MTITYLNNIPYLEEQNLNDLIKKIQTPFYLYSQNKITDNYKKLKKSLDSEIYFSVKSNSNQAIISHLYSLGAGFDVVSEEEILRVLNVGVSPSKIIFEGVGKTESSIRLAITKKIKQINVESIEELKTINEIALSLNTTQEIGIRINPDIDANTINKISTGRKNDKFGICFDELKNICEILKNLKNINFSSLTCHIGSQIFEIETFKNIFYKMKESINICEKNKCEIKHLDLGGGFGFDYNYKKKFDLTQLANLIKNTFKKNEYKISFEPGRYIIANAGYLITKIITCKTNGDINFLITDAGMQTLLRPAIYNSFHKIIPFNKENDEKTYTIAGPICESSDILANNIKLPLQKKNDYLIICDVGAYGSVMSSNYNSKCLPAEVLIKENKYLIIREAENINDIIKKDIIPNW